MINSLVIVRHTKETYILVSYLIALSIVVGLMRVDVFNTNAYVLPVILAILLVLAVILLWQTYYKLVKNNSNMNKIPMVIAQWHLTVVILTTSYILIMLVTMYYKEGFSTFQPIPRYGDEADTQNYTQMKGIQGMVLSLIGTVFVIILCPFPNLLIKMTNTSETRQDKKIDPNKPNSNSNQFHVGVDETYAC